MISLSSCTNYSKKEITDVSKQQAFLLFSKNKTPSDFKLYVTGNTDGAFDLHLLQKRFNSEKIDTFDSFQLSKGIIDTVFWGEWYNDTIHNGNIFWDFTPNQRA